MVEESDMRRIIIPILLYILTSGLFSASRAEIIGSPSEDSVIHTEILQYKSNRLFFTAGRESNVFPQSPFRITYGDKTIFSGMIEFSMPGLSYSLPLADLALERPLHEYRVVIGAAALDSLSPIKIGRVKDFLMVGDSMPEANLPGNPLKLFTFKDEQELSLALSQNELDIRLSYYEGNSGPTDMTCSSYLVPQMAVLIPNLARDFNSAGFLTTSLYYRFDSRRLEFVFNGDSMLSSPSFVNQNDSVIREFDYNPESGRKLLDYLEIRPGKITLTYSHSNLARAAEYFARLLNRDKIQVTVRQASQPGDIHLGWIPIDKDRSLSVLKILVDLLYPQAIDNAIARRKLDIISTYLDEALHADTESRRLYYAGLAERSLKNDLGVFPLFRPRAYISSLNHIQWPVTVSESNWPDFSRVIRLTLPSQRGSAP